MCYNVEFSELKKSELSTLDEIRDRFGCSGGCGMCAKYIELMLQTGDVAFPILWGAEFKRYLIDRGIEPIAQKRNDSV